MAIRKHTFNLRLWFAVGSFGTIALIYVVSAYWISGFLTNSLLERESEVSQEFLESIVVVDGVEMFYDDGSQPFRQSPALLDYAKHIVSMPGILRVNIHAQTHRILWSTEKEIVGKVFEVNDELGEAFRGRRVTEIGTLPDPKKPEHVGLGQSGHFIEAYIPIRSLGGRGPVVGVVELYKQPMALVAAIEHGSRIVWFGATVAALVLFFTLYWIVQRGAQLIERQQHNLAQMEAFAAIGQMASAVAHSLRNPMSAIRSTAELWRSQQQNERCEISDEVIREVDRMDSYVRDLLAYARAERCDLRPIDPLKVIQAIIVKQQNAVARNKIATEIVDARGEPTRVMADEMLLEQALTSIVTNSIEAMPEGGKLQAKMAAGRNGQVRIEFADTGHGIPEQLIQRVTESYFTTKARGLGLGLVLAKGIIERFEGRFEIASCRGSGTNVVVELKSA